MKRPKQHVLEEDSKRAFISLLPSEWIHREKHPDYGIDMEVELVEGEDVTNKVFWVQLKATESIKLRQKKIIFKAETDHLKFWEACRLPVFIMYWIKSKNTFYYLFAQRYIRDKLSMENPYWRNQKYATIKFPLDSKLDDTRNLRSIADDGYFFIIEQQLNEKQKIERGTHPAHYWLNGIPKSDDKELKRRTLKALSLALDYKFPSAIKEYEKILRELTISPSERMSILLNLGNAYSSISQNNNALKNYDAMLKLTAKVSENEAIQGKSSALGNIGLIYRERGELDQALKYQKEALKIDKHIGNKRGEAFDLVNIGLIYLDKGELGEALKYNKAALKIDKETGDKQSEAASLSNIGRIYSDKGELQKAHGYYKVALQIHKEIGFKQSLASNLGSIGAIFLLKGELETALKYQEEALKIHREIGDKQGTATALGNIGLIYSDKGELKKSLKYHQEALEMSKEIGYKRGEADNLGNIGLINKAKGAIEVALKYLQKAIKIHKSIECKQAEATGLCNIGLIYLDKGEQGIALRYLKDALKIDKEIGYKQGEASDLGNIGVIYRAIGELDQALKYHIVALKIDRGIGYKQGEANQLRHIGLIYLAKGELYKGLKYIKNALHILDKYKLVHGRDTIQSAIDVITKKRP